MTDSQAHPDPLGAHGEPGEPSQSTLESFVEVSELEWPSEPPADSAGETGTDTPIAPEALSVIGCTVVCRGQLPAAQVLRDSFLRHHPYARFAVLVADDPRSGAETTEPREAGRTSLLTPADVGVGSAELARLAAACTADQLRAVLRPRLLSRLLPYGVPVLSLEPSVQVFGPFDDLLAGLTPQRPVALAPRVLRPLVGDELRPSPSDLLEAGTFDLSLFAVSVGAEEFLQLWADQMLADPASSEAFLEGASALVDHHVLRDPGVGLSVWNAAQRELTVSSDGQHTVNGSPLRSVHFDDFQPERPWLLSVAYADRPRVLLSEHPVLARLCANYRNALVSAGYTREEPHRFHALPDGTAIPDSLRAEYRKALARAEQGGEAAPASPFDPGGRPGDPAEEAGGRAEDDGAADPVAIFLRWACEPGDARQRAVGGSRWTEAVWRDDPLLRRDFPDPFGADAEGFREWCADVGVTNGRVPAAAVRRDPTGHQSALVDQLGVAVLGGGEVAELVRAAVRSSGLPSADTPSYPVVVRCDGDELVPAGRHLIDIRPDAGLSHGPGERTPDRADETWVLSEASRHAARRAGSRVTRVVALPLPDPGIVDLPTRKAARARIGLSDEFVFAAEVDHSAERHGNVLGLVTAFFNAFPERVDSEQEDASSQRQDVRLLLSVTGGSEYPEASERLRLAIVSDPRIVLIEHDVPDVVAASDCVVSLHRAEGGVGGDHVALRLLGAAVRGVPVLASDHGAVSELLGGQGAKLVACQGAGEPDLTTAAEMLRAIAEHPEDTARFGLAARQYLLAEHNVTQAGERLRDRVEHAYRSWRTKWSKGQHGQLDDPLRPLLIARHALHRPPDVGAGSRNAMAPALRKAVLKALGHYDQHIREVMRSLVDGVEQTAAELLRKQYEAGEIDIESLRSELTQLAHRQQQLGDQLAGTEDGVVRSRAELVGHGRQLTDLRRELESESTKRDEQVSALAERLDRLTAAMERTLDRLDSLESTVAESLHDRDGQVGAELRSATQSAAFAAQRTDVLQRILLREHERQHGSDDGTTALVVCDAGLLRLPAEDSLMLPWLSSHTAWDAEVSALIDSLLEPDGIFLDVGSYVGYQTVRVLSRLGTSGAVVAVEPSERARELLERNVEINLPAAVAQRLTVISGAAWDGQCELIAEDAISGGLSVRPVTPELAGEDEPESPKAPGVRLDKELETLGELRGLRLSVVHVDLGGRVHRALGGLVRLLRKDRPHVVCSFTPEAVEQLGDDPAAALREFGTWGYDLVPVGRTQAVSAEELLEAMATAGASSTVKLWLRPRGKAG